MHNNNHSSQQWKYFPLENVQKLTIFSSHNVISTTGWADITIADRYLPPRPIVLALHPLPIHGSDGSLAQPATYKNKISIGSKIFYHIPNKKNISMDKSCSVKLVGHYMERKHYSESKLVGTWIDLSI